MERLEIEVPNTNDSVSRVTLDGAQYQIRFSYNSTADYWSYGLSTILGDPIIQGIKIVPRFPLNLFATDERLPNGIFGAYTDLDRIGRNDFIDGKAIFAYISANQEVAS